MKYLSELVLISALTGTFLLFTAFLNQSQSMTKDVTKLYNDRVTITR